MEAHHEGCRRGPRRPSSYLPPKLLLTSSYRAKGGSQVILSQVGVSLLFLAFLALGCAPRTAIKPQAEPWDIIQKTNGEKIECRVLEIGFPEVEIQPRYGAFSFIIDRSELKQINYGDGRVEYYFHGLKMPPESVEVRKLQERETTKKAWTTNRKYYAVMGMFGGLPITCLLGFSQNSLIGFTPLYLIYMAAPMAFGTAVGYNYGKQKDIKEAKKRDLLKPKPDSLAIPGLKVYQK